MNGANEISSIKEVIMLFVGSFKRYIIFSSLLLVLVVIQIWAEIDLGIVGGNFVIQDYTNKPILNVIEKQKQENIEKVIAKIAFGTESPDSNEKLKIENIVSAIVKEFPIFGNNIVKSYKLSLIWYLVVGYFGLLGLFFYLYKNKIEKFINKHTELSISHNKNFEAIKNLKNRINNIKICDWPFAYLFQAKDRAITGKEDNLTCVSIVEELVDKYENTINDLDIMIKQPLKAICGFYIAEVWEFLENENIPDLTIKDSLVKRPYTNVALVRIRPATEADADNINVENGSLIYEGISLNTEKKIHYWQTSSLCVDIFSLKLGETKKKKASLLFKTTKGRIIELVDGKKPESIKNTRLNFGDIEVPSHIIAPKPGRPDDETIVATFRDISIDKDGGQSIQLKVAKLTALKDELYDNNLNENIDELEKRVEAHSEKLLNLSLSISSRILKTQSVRNEEVFLTDSQELFDNFSHFLDGKKLVKIENEPSEARDLVRWSTNGIFRRFRKEEETRKKTDDKSALEEDKQI